jgi:hypothetical protein
MRGRPSNYEVQKAFDLYDKTDSAGKSLKYAKCKHCKAFDAYAHTTRMNEHLLNCGPYQIRELEKHNVGDRVMKQSTIKSKKEVLTTTRVEQIKEALAEAVYIDGLPFNVFETRKQLSKAIRNIHEAVKLPNRSELAGPLLKRCFEKYSRLTDNIVLSEPGLNLIVDESNNIQKSRIVVVCINSSSKGAFFASSEVLKGVSMTGEFSANWTYNQMKKMVDPEGKATDEELKQLLKKINSVALDTCPTQRKAIRLMQQMPGLQHVFMVGCDSHGLQLLLGDLIKQIPLIKHVLDIAQSIVTSFSNSAKMLAILRDIMQKQYNKVFSFVISVITRWGTQFAMVRSVSRTKAAIHEFFETMQEDQLRDQLKLLKQRNIQWDQAFWRNLTFTLNFLEPLDEAIRMSEADHAVIGHVVPRWKRLRKYFVTGAREWKQEDPKFGDIDEIFKKRYNRYVLGTKPDLQVQLYLAAATWQSGDPDTRF